MQKNTDHSALVQMLAQPHNYSVSWDPAFLDDIPRGHKKGQEIFQLKHATSNTSVIWGLR